MDRRQDFVDEVNAAIRDKAQRVREEFADEFARTQPRAGAYQRSYRAETHYDLHDHWVPTTDDYIDADYRIVEVEPLALPDGTQE